MAGGDPWRRLSSLQSRDSSRLFFLPVKLQRHLHLPAGIRLSGNDAEIVAVEIGAGIRKHRAIEDIECLGAEIQPEPFGKAEGFSQADILVEIREAADERIEARAVAKDSCRLRRKSR